MLCVIFLGVFVVVLIVIVSKKDVMVIKEFLNLKNFLEIIGNLNRFNIMYKKVFCKGDDVDFYEDFLKFMVNDLK